MNKKVKSKIFHYNFFPKSRKGSHVGMVLSFMVFVTFLVFLFSITEPAIKTQEDKKALLDYLETELTEMVSEEMTTATIKIDNSGSKECVILTGDEKDKVSAIADLDKLVFKDDENKILEYSYSGGNLLIKTGTNYDGILKIYSSSLDHSPLYTGSGCTPTNDCEVGLVRTKEYIFEKEVDDLRIRYNSDYDDLKNDLKIPDENDFWFSLKNNLGVVVVEPNIEDTGLKDVYSEEIPVQYIDDNSNILTGFINIKVW